MLLFALTALFSCSCSKKAEEKEEKVSPEVKVVSPIRQKMSDYLTLNGNVIFLNYEDVRATFSGYIENVGKSFGDNVGAGENLFIIKTKEASLIDSSSKISNDIKFKGLVRINAKTGGNLIKIFKHTGDYVIDGEELAQLAIPQSLRISLSVPFKYMSLVKNTSNFKISLPDGRQFDAKVGNIMPSVDQAGQTQTVLLVLQKGAFIPDSLNVSVLIPNKVSDAAVVLPKSAILTDETQSEFWIMKLVNDSLAVKVNIKKGIENPQFVQIIEPVLNQDDKFIIEGGYGLEDSTKVKISNDPE
jgi:multidrug efflux pump subunit AcrA (membrane-fusion protein)